MASTSRRRRVGWTLLKLAFGLSLLGYVASRRPLGELAVAFASVGPLVMLGAMAIWACSMWVAALRWQILMNAYGAERRIGLPRLVSLYMQGMFFNTFLPGAVGGDVLRAHLVRDSFASPVASYAGVLLERVFGFAALACLSATALLVRLVPRDTADFAPYLGLAAASVAVTVGCALHAPALARRVAKRWDTGRIGQVAQLFAKAPDLVRPRLLAYVLALSFGTQAVGIATTYLVTRDLAPSVVLVDCLLFVPLANLAAYFPLTFGGLGAREATFVALFARIGVSESHALAASLLMFGLQALMAVCGGVLYAVDPHGRSSPKTAMPERSET